MPENFPPDFCRLTAYAQELKLKILFSNLVYFRILVHILCSGLKFECFSY